jgi:hypothetical protein
MGTAHLVWHSRTKEGPEQPDHEDGRHEEGHTHLWGPSQRDRLDKGGRLGWRPLSSSARLAIQHRVSQDIGVWLIGDEDLSEGPIFPEGDAPEATYIGRDAGCNGAATADYREVDASLLHNNDVHPGDVDVSPSGKWHLRVQIDAVWRKGARAGSTVEPRHSVWADHFAHEPDDERRKSQREPSPTDQSRRSYWQLGPHQNPPGNRSPSYQLAKP